MTTRPGKPTRVVLDTNLLVGHLFRPEAAGLADLVARWKSGTVCVCISQPIRREMEATIRRIPVDAERKREILDLLNDPERTTNLDDVPDSGFRCDDPEDDKFLHRAAAGDAQALLTSDRALLRLSGGFPVPILKVGDWLRRTSE